MTDTNWRDLLPNWKIVIPTALVGVVLGILIYVVTISSNNAVALVRTGRVGNIEAEEPRTSLDRGSQFLMDRIQTYDFAASVAARLGDTSLATDLAGRQYGGLGKLQVRQVGDGTLLELRVNLTDARRSVDVANAAAEQAVEDDVSMLRPLRDLRKSQLAALQQQAATATSISNSLAKQPFDTSTQAVLLLTAASEGQKTANNITAQLWRLQANLAAPASLDSAVISSARISRPVIRAWWIAAIAGALAGGAVGYFLSLSRRQRQSSLD